MIRLLIGIMSKAVSRFVSALLKLTKIESARNNDMAKKYGVDLSSFNGTIDFAQVATEKSFIIVRAGYGDLNGSSTHIDPRAATYIQNAKANGMEIAGIYWYSYTRTVAYAAVEAQRACDFLTANNLYVPIFFDFELEYEGYTNTPQEVRDFCTSFTNKVIINGFAAGVYFDPNYYSNYYGSTYINNLRSMGVKIWYANWYTAEPSIEYDIWQYSDSGSVSGITGNVDLDVMKYTPSPTPKNKKLPIIYYPKVF